MIEVERRLAKIAGRSAAAVGKVFHEGAGGGFLAFQQQGQEDLELGQLGFARLLDGIGLAEEILKPGTRRSVVAIIEWQLGQVELRRPEGGIGLDRLLEHVLRLLVVVLAGENQAPQVGGIRLIGLHTVRFIQLGERAGVVRLEVIDVSRLVVILENLARAD